MRTLTTIVGLPIMIAFIYYGGMPLKIFILLLSLAGMSEVFGALGVSKKLVTIPTYIAAVFYFIFIDKLDGTGIIFIISLMVFIMMTIVVLNHTLSNVYDVSISMFGFIYVCILMSTLLLIRVQPNGLSIIWLVFISSWGCDTGAYLVGKTFGKRKLAPSLSPNKTIEGSIGGILFSMLLAAVYGFYLNFNNDLTVENPMALCVIAVFFGSIFSQLGDLFASSIKRHTGIKDFGFLIPGHGGVIDRFDSILTTSPIVYCVFLLVQRFTS